MVLEVEQKLHIFLILDAQLNTATKAMGHFTKKLGKTLKGGGNVPFLCTSVLVTGASDHMKLS